MKRILSIALIALAFAAATAEQFMFSRDGVKPGSSLRELPSQGVDLQTGRVIVGLHALDDMERMACGWYRYEANPKPDTNHYWRVTNYVFSATGTVSAVWSEYTPKARPLRYSKLDILEKLAEMGKWAQVKAAMEASGYMDRWNACTYIAADNERFLAIKPAIAQILGVTEKQLDEMLKECIYK